MTPEEREALLAAYALGTLSEPDQRDAERLVRVDATAAAEWRAYREIADLIALGAPQRQPDPSLRERVLAAARRRGHPWRRTWRERYMPLVGMAAILGIVTLWAVKLQSDIGYLQRQTRDLTNVIGQRDPGASAQAVSSLGLQLQTVRRDQQTMIAVQADPKVRKVPLEDTPASHGAGGLYLWSEQANAGVVSLYGLPQLPLGQQYKVWLEDRLSRLILDSTFLPDEQGDVQVVLEANRVVEPVRIYIVAGKSDGKDGPVVLQGTIWRDEPVKIPH
ncbi:MAG: hypothetical protein EPO65_04985 [Dehalococcoidia bacterium]|nr:MAG: hypothetical protein EPO65_04985 [Dehalococcoidia bacterium]